jgi:hypothetical protein
VYLTKTVLLLLPKSLSGLHNRRSRCRLRDPRERSGVSK